MKKIFNNKLLYINKHFIYFIIISMIFNSLVVITPLISAQLINKITGNIDTLIRYIFIFIGVAIFKLIISALFYYLGSYYVSDLKCKMRIKTFAGFIDRNFQKQKRENRAEYVSFVNNVIPTLAQDYCKALADIINCISLLIFSAVALFNIHWIFMSIILLISFAMIYVPKIFTNKGTIHKTKYNKSLEKFNLVLDSFLEGIQLIKSHNYSHSAKKNSKC